MPCHDPRPLLVHSDQRDEKKLEVSDRTFLNDSVKSFFVLSSLFKLFVSPTSRSMSSLGSLRNSVGLGRLSLCLAELDMEEREVENSRCTVSHKHHLIVIRPLLWPISICIFFRRSNGSVASSDSEYY